MNDPTNSWEDDWRDELAGYEAPQQADDWAGMEVLLAGGVAAPAEPVPPGPAAAGYVVWWKGIAFVLALMAAGGVGYLLNGDSLTDQLANFPAVMTNRLPPGVQDQVGTVYKRHGDGHVDSWVDSAEIKPTEPGRLSPDPLTPDKNSSSITQNRYRFDTLFQLNHRGESIGIERIDTVNLQESSRFKSRSGGTSLNEIPELNLPALPTNLAPAAAPRSAPVAPIQNKFPHDLPDNATLLRQRLLRIVKERPLTVTPSDQNNGYFPPVRNNR